MWLRDRQGNLLAKPTQYPLGQSALHESAKVDGDIMHQSLSISEGAEFDGRVQRAKDPSELMPVLDAEAFASQPGKDNDEASHFGRDNDKPLGDLVDEI